MGHELVCGQASGETIPSLFRKNDTIPAIAASVYAWNPMESGSFVRFK